MERIDYLDNEAIILEDGAYVSSLTLGGIPAIQRSVDGYKTHGGISLLIPYADIVYGAKYSFEGIEYLLPKNATYENDFKNSIHGLTNDLRWNVKKKMEGYLKMACIVENPGYPSKLGASVTYKLKHNSFHIEISLKNLGEKSCPVMVGLHPYFKSDGKWKIICDEPLVSLKGITDKEVQSDLIHIDPFESYEISNNNRRIFDDCFLGGGNIHIITNNTTIELRRDNLPFFSVYNGPFAPKNSFSIVPMSAAPNSFNNKFGLKSLKPKESFNCRLSIKLLNPLP